MPTLHWIGKEKVQNHHLDVPFRVLEKQYAFGEKNAQNRIIHGDNLEALKALLPEYEGRVKCIYIDPPYNTGNEGWAYNDAVNDPKILRWLHKTVGKEGEDLSRHDKWLCMMYPRLRLLHKLLADDGAIFISIDDNEQAHLRLVLDEIFGAGNFLANVAWEKRFTRSNNAKLFYSLKDSILIYRKSNLVSYIREGRTEKADSLYSNPDNDERGEWAGSSYVNPATKEKRKNLVYPIKNPFTKQVVEHPTHAWKYSKEEHNRHVKDKRLYWGADGGYTFPRLKNFLSEAQGMVPVDLWSYKEVGTTDDGGKILTELFGEKGLFETPKPASLIEKIIGLICDENSIILDSFAGSGTTAHSVLNLNKADGGHRQFILIEMENYAETLTAERVRRVISGYSNKEGTGGGFEFYGLGAAVFLENGYLNEEVGASEIRKYVWHAETKAPQPPGEAARHPYFLGKNEATDWWFCYERERAVLLDVDLLAIVLAQKTGENAVIYADFCTVPDDLMKKHNLRFKKIPRDIPKI